jgi:fluoroquinolone transport system permease protein
MSMLMVIAASNKVEGLAISKLLGILLLGIPFAWFGTITVKVLGAIMPTYWMTKMLTAAATDFNAYLLDFAAALLCVFVWIAVMLYIFKRKVR